MTRVISQEEFSARIKAVVASIPTCGVVTGPGRSGAVAAVYASHILHIPFIPFGSLAPANLGRLLIIDTASESGQTLRKAARRYAYANPLVIACYQEPPRVMFWYESGKPQRYAHEVSGMNIHDNGQNDPLEYVLDRNDKAVADFAGKVIHIHRMQLNDRDKAREAAANEREIARALGVG